MFHCRLSRSVPRSALPAHFQSAVCRRLSTAPVTYQQLYKQSLENPEQFWAQRAQQITWESTNGPIFTQTGSNPWEYKWFPEHTLNTCYNMVDVHVKNGRGKQNAIIYDSPVTHSQKSITFDELQETVAQMAGAMLNSGVKRGDVVLIYMPMIPETIAAMLACARIGAIHSVVFGGFASTELAKRIMDSKPKMILSASCGVEPKKLVPYKPMLDEAIEIAKHSPTCVILQRPQLKADLIPGRDIDWSAWIKNGGGAAPCVTLKGSDPLYILYTSGTTGMPKGVLRDNGEHAVAMKFVGQVMCGMKEGSVFFSASDLGWAVGHSFTVYAPLFNGCTTVLFEGKPIGTPDPGAFWRVIQQYKVEGLFTAPTALRALKKEDPTGEYVVKYDISSLAGVYLAGERADPDSVKWAQQHIKAPIIDNYWQSETGWPIVGNCRGVDLLPVKVGSATKPMPGYDLRILDDEGNPVPAGKQGNVVVKLPLPPGSFHTLYNNHERYVRSYMSRFPGYYDTADAGLMDEDGYIHIMSRTDDVMNVAGHRLGSGQMEEVLASHPAVAETAVISVTDVMKGELPVGFIVLKKGVTTSEAELQKQIIAEVRHRIGAVACFHHVYVVPRLPKTRSGKILRATMRKMAIGMEVGVPATIEDDSVLPELKQIMLKNGLGKENPYS